MSADRATCSQAEAGNGRPVGDAPSASGAFPILDVSRKRSSLPWQGHSTTRENTSCKLSPSHMPCVYALVKVRCSRRALFRTFPHVVKVIDVSAGRLGHVGARMHHRDLSDFLAAFLLAAERVAVATSLRSSCTPFSLAAICAFRSARFCCGLRDGLPYSIHLIDLN